jgi:hypothetical protein
MRWHQFFVLIRPSVMKPTLLLIALELITCCFSQAQSSDIIRIKGGVGGEKAVPFNARYRYDQFRTGRVLYLNGSTATARLNYNVILGEMQFIDSRGDTLALADESLLRLVSIGGVGSSQEDLFVYDKTRGYLALVADYKGTKLAEKEGLRMAKSEKQGGYGQSSGSSAITTYQFYSPGSTSISKLDGQGDLLLIKDKMYFIVDQNGRTYLANKANIVKVFSKHRDQVITYLANESVDFRQEKDLKKLLSYCADLL